ncbi:MAG: glycosyltransferase [Elusimicrobia bacterium]|nr:glycosyltransferase [Elusimicrobiota bacterium]
MSKLYAPWIGGVERHIQDIAEGLGDKFDVKVLCCQEPWEKGRGSPESEVQSPRSQQGAGNEGLGTKVRGSGTENFYIPSRAPLSSINGVSIIKAPSLGMIWSMPVSFSFPGHLKELSQDIDLIHYHLPFPLAVTAHLWVRPKAPFVVTWHSDVVRQKTVDTLMRPLTHSFLRQARTILVTSSTMIKSSDVLKEHRNKCEVVPLGVDIGRFAVSSENFREVAKIRIQFPGFLALFVGRFVPYKGLEFLLRAAALLPASVRLLLVGDGPLEKYLKKLAQTLALGERVVFLGPRPPQGIVSLYHACDVFVLPSVTPNEAFGIVQIEAMACGKPVINTWLASGVPEVSLHGETGLTVPPGDPAALAQAIRRLSQDESLKVRFGREGIKRVRENYDLRVIFSRIAELYRNAVS